MNFTDPGAATGPGAAGFEGPGSVIDAQVEAMLQRVTENRDRRCAQLRAEALRQAQDILRAARKEARANVGAAVARERKQGEQALRLARANADLDERRRSQLELRAVLEDMWAAISGALESRWADPMRRQSWVRAAVRQGHALLRAPAWRIEHGSGWSQQELDELKRLAAPDAAREIELACHAALGAGIRIRTKGACLDATVAGLLASRGRIESDFLAQYLADSSTAARPGSRESA